MAGIQVSVALFYCLVYVLALSLLPTQVHASKCVWTDPTNSKTYDLSPLSNNTEDYVLPLPVQRWVIWINVCRPLLYFGCSKYSPDVSACQVYNPDFESGSFSLGLDSDATFEHLKQIDGDGVTMMYTYGWSGRAYQIDFICDKAAGKGVPTFISENPLHYYNFEFHSSYACAL